MTLLSAKMIPYSTKGDRDVQARIATGFARKVRAALTRYCSRERRQLSVVRRKQVDSVRSLHNPLVAYTKQRGDATKCAAHSAPSKYMRQLRQHDVFQCGCG